MKQNDTKAYPQCCQVANKGNRM